MSASSLETILLPEDLAGQVSLHCLACRRRLGSIGYAEHELSDGPRLAVSLALVPGALEDFQQGHLHMVLICGCGSRSTYHLL